jgi:single-strand DNA-binding protein
MQQVKGTVNRVELIGWLGAEPELRFLSSGVAVCSFRVATKRFAGRNEAGERLIETEWTTVDVWDKPAERCAQMLHKGSRVRVVGSMQTRSWEDRETGQKRFKTVVRAEDVMSLDARPDAHDDDEVAEDAVEVVEDLPF